MKKYKFRLESVLRVRRLQLEQRRQELMVANHDLTMAEQRLSDRRLRYLEFQQQSGVSTQAEYAQHLFRWDQAARAIEIADNYRLACVAEVEIRRNAYMDARQVVEALERLDIRRRDEYLVDTNRQEIAEVDDIVNGNRHHRLQDEASREVAS